MPYRTRRPVIAILGMTLLVTTALLAAAPKGVFPVRHEDGGRTLVLNGTGLCEWGAFNWNLYWGALYLEKKSTDPRTVINSEQAKRIHLYFVRALSQEQMIKAYSKSFEINAGKNLPRYQKGLDELTSMLTAVKKGTSLTFTYLPKKGIRVDQNGTTRGTIVGQDFAKKFFELYFGPNPPDENLKKGMLGNSGKK